jgi:hypothetical protein
LRSFRFPGDDPSRSAISWIAKGARTWLSGSVVAWSRLPKMRDSLSMIFLNDLLVEKQDLLVL